MKKITKYALGLIISLIFAGNSFAWTITDFHSDIQINADGSANVTETITGDFSRDLQKHGIYRYIPFRSKTSNGKTNYTPISRVSVANENGNSRNFQQSEKNDNIFLKIGDANRNVKSREIYVIKYVIQNVPKSFPENGFDEFYWNVTGNEWDTVIEKASATISLPQSSGVGNTICFTGKYGSTAQNCTASVDENGKANFAGISPLQIGEGLTVDFGFDRGIVQTFELADIPWWKRFFEKFGIWILAALMPIFSIGYAWKKKKELEVDKPIIPKYEPPENLHPTMIGTVIDGRYDKRDFTAGIIDLAVHGLLEIEKKHIKGLVFDSDEYFLKQNPAKKSFTSVLRANFYENLFGGIVIVRGEDEKEGVFPSHHRESMYQIFNSIKKDARRKKYFKGAAKMGGLGFIFLIIWLFPFLGGILGGLGDEIKIAVGGLVLAVFAGFAVYPNRTKAGYKLAHEAKCYKEFLETAEIDQLNWAEKQEIFEKNLPYAVAFGLTKKWTRVFGNIIQSPQWMHTGNVNHLSRDISRITSDISSNIQAPKSSSGGSGFGGGGFSGGGSGGGGGGSW